MANRLGRVATLEAKVTVIHEEIAVLIDDEAAPVDATRIIRIVEDGTQSYKTVASQPI